MQGDAFPPPLPLPFADNSSRWNRFIYWAPLGSRHRPFGLKSIAARLVPDCTVAVRETMLSLWKEGQSVCPSEALARVLAELPVLPGGGYSRSLGLEAPEDAARQVSPMPSSLGRKSAGSPSTRESDAADVIFLLDADGTRVAVSNVMINGGNSGRIRRLQVLDARWRGRLPTEAVVASRAFFFATTRR